MQVTTIGLDLAKNVFQVHGVTNEGEVADKSAFSCTAALKPESTSLFQSSDDNNDLASSRSAVPKPSSKDIRIGSRHPMASLR